MESLDNQTIADTETAAVDNNEAQTDGDVACACADVSGAAAGTPSELAKKDKKAKKSKKKEYATPEEKEAAAAARKKRLHNFLFIPLMVVLAAALRSIVVRVFMTSPTFNFAPGGVTGIGTMIEYKTGFSTGYTNIIINVPLMIIAFLFLNKGFAIKSAAAVGLSSVGMILMQKLDFPQYGFGANDDPVLAAMACGVLGGIGIAIMIRAGGSNGGTDIVAAFIQRKYAATNITWFIMGLDCTIILSSYFVYDNGITPLLMSAVQQFCSAMMGDVILTGLKSAIKYEIITDDPEALSAELISKLKHSVTKLDAVGMYAHSNKALLICVIHKRQVTDFNNILKKYPNTFAYVQSTSEVLGKFV